MLNLQLKNIVFASNFEPESYPIFPIINLFANRFEANIHLLKIITPYHFETTRTINEKISKFIHNGSEGDKPENIKSAIYADDNEELGILNYCIENDIDMIVVGTHGKGIIWKLFNESTSQNIVSHSFRPVLTVKI